jgi:hypothetical protein
MNAGFISVRVNLLFTIPGANGKAGWNSPAGLTAEIEDDATSYPFDNHTGSPWCQSQDFHRSGVRVSPVRSRAGDAFVFRPCYPRSRRGMWRVHFLVLNNAIFPAYKAMAPTLSRIASIVVSKWCPSQQPDFANRGRPQCWYGTIGCPPQEDPARG